MDSYGWMWVALQAAPATAGAGPSVPAGLWVALGGSLLAVLVLLVLWVRAWQARRRLEREARVLHHELVAQRAEATARINKLERALRQAVEDPEAVRQRLEDLLPTAPYVPPPASPSVHPLPPPVHPPPPDA